jgi:hypothetical protein
MARDVHLKTLLVGALIGLSGLTVGNAVSLIGYEWIAHYDPPDPWWSTLGRTRDSTIPHEYLNVDVYFQYTERAEEIIAENNLSRSFGVVGLCDVSYSHQIGWMNTACPIEFAQLTIDSYNALGNDDIVFAAGFELGPLEEHHSTTFRITERAMLDVLFSDGHLDIYIEKNKNADSSGKLNASRIEYSELSVFYSDARVLEPSSVLGSLAALALGALVIIRRRRA